MSAAVIPCDRCNAPRLDIDSSRCAKCGFCPADELNIVMLEDQSGHVVGTIGDNGWRGASGHLERMQYWMYGGTEPELILLAHPAMPEFSNNSSNFYFKHVLHPSKKRRTPEEKLLRRHQKRNMPPKQREAGRGKGEYKEFSKDTSDGALSWSEKYGTTRGVGGVIPDNTAIDLSLISLDEVRARFYEAICLAPWRLGEAEILDIRKKLDAAGKTHIPVDPNPRERDIKVEFGRNCVLQVGKTRRTYDHVWVSVRRHLGDGFKYFSVFHLKFEKMV